MDIYVSARKLSFPFACPCCGGEPDAQMAVEHTRRSGKRVVRETTRSWTFPYCSRCIAHVERWDSGTNYFVVFMIAAIVFGITVGLLANEGSGWTVGMMATVLGVVFYVRERVRAQRMRLSSCISAARTIRYLGWDGSVHGFSIESSSYVLRFARGNMGHLVNVDPALWRALQEPELRPPRAVAPAPEAPKQASSSPRASAPSERDRALEWIARIESYKGAVARRNALARALEEIHDPTARTELLIAATKIEVAAVLDKVDALGTVAAKRRHLEKAIADIMSDNIPDELQAEELRQLRDRLANLQSG